MNPAVLAHQQRIARVRASTVSAVAHMWDQLPDLHEPQAAPFADRASRAVGAGQLLAARSTAVYVSQRLRIPTVAVDPAKVTGEAVRKGVKPQKVYQRPFGIVWGALADGASLDEARGRGRERLSLMAAMDIFLAVRAASSYVADRSSGTVVWVRIADPGACDLCAAEDGATYETGDDFAGHPHCGCTIDPRPSSDSTAADPSATSTHVSDELGALLYQAGHAFEGA